MPRHSSFVDFPADLAKLKLNQADFPLGQEGCLHLCGINLGKTIGEGTFGKVKMGYRGDKYENGMVAVKIMNRNKIKSLNVAGRVKREIRHLQKFQHPHIIKLHKCVSTPTEIFMIMEYAPGGDVFQYICGNGKLSEKDSRLLFQQLISGVDYLHRNMVVHRDLKPENLLLDEPKRNLKIADFGLSNLMVDGTFMATSCGSPNYAAPEVISASLYAGPEVDLWSCGIILYTFLCGILPFDHDDVRILYRKIISGQFSIPSDITAGAQRVLQGCLTVDQTKRWTVEDLKKDSWFQQDLAGYLFAPVSLVETAVANKLAVRTVAEKFDCTEGDVTKSLLGGNPNDFKTVAYHILSDNQDTQKKGSASPGSMDRGCLEACIRPGQKFCRPGCDMCPKWGAKECVFSVFIPDLSKCDTCTKHGDAGCIWSDDKVTEDAGFKKGMELHRHRERIDRPPALSHTLEYENAFTRRLSDSVDFKVHDGQSKRSTTKAYNYNHMVQRSKNKKAKWHLGMRAVYNPEDLMIEIYRIMKGLDFEWRFEKGSLYHCVARKRNVQNSPQIRLQLYSTDSKNGHLLDFRSVTDSHDDYLPEGETNQLNETDYAIEAFEAEQPHDLDGVPNLSSSTIRFFDLCAEIIASLSS